METKSQQLEKLKMQIEVLEMEIHSRSTRFRKNQQLIQVLLDAEHSPRVEEELQRYTMDNRSILEENEQALERQNQLINAYVQLAWQQQHLPAESSQLRFSECLTLTLDGMIPLDEQHPYYHDEYFLTKVLQRLEAGEQYERCMPVAQRLNSLRQRVPVQAIA